MHTSQNLKTVLLVQARPPRGEATRHEHRCIQRRVHGRQVRVVARSMFAQRPSPRWLDGVDAVVMGGSGSLGVHDAEAQAVLPALRRLIDACLDRGIPGFGICFGHQVLGFHLGAAVATDPRRAERGTVTCVRSRRASIDPVFRHLGPRFRAHAGHADHVAEVPAGVTLLAHNTTLKTQAFKVNGAPFYSTQFHPDMNADEARWRYRRCASHLARSPQELEAQARAFDPACRDTDSLMGQFLDWALPVARRGSQPRVARHRLRLPARPRPMPQQASNA